MSGRIVGSAYTSALSNYATASSLCSSLYFAPSQVELRSSEAQVRLLDRYAGTLGLREQWRALWAEAEAVAEEQKELQWMADTKQTARLEQLVSTALHCAAQHSAVQHSAVQCSTIQVDVADL